MRKLILRAPSRRQSHVTIYVRSTFPYLRHENIVNQLSALDGNYTLNHQFHDVTINVSSSIPQAEYLFHDNETLITPRNKNYSKFHHARVSPKRQKKKN